MVLMMDDEKAKSLVDLVETMLYRNWLLQMGLLETHTILLTGSDTIYG